MHEMWKGHPANHNSCTLYGRGRCFVTWLTIQVHAVYVACADYDCWRLLASSTHDAQSQIKSRTPTLTTNAIDHLPVDALYDNDVH